jgi:putative oxidoreductase
MNIPFQNDAVGKLIVRLTVGGLILFHGVSKLGNPAGAIAYVSKTLTEAGLPTFLSYLVFFGEVLAPLLIIFGLFARLGGLMVVVNMLFAFGLVHTGQFFTMNKMGGWSLELQAFYLLSGLAVFFLGSGKYALKPDSEVVAAPAARDTVLPLRGARV